MTAAAWHRALLAALTGKSVAAVGAQQKPDLDELFAVIESSIDGGVDGVRAMAEERLRQGLTWPYPVPERLREGVGAAQLQAVIGQAVRRLGLVPERRTQQVAAPRAPDADEQRLLREVPPHHGV